MNNKGLKNPAAIIAASEASDKLSKISDSAKKTVSDINSKTNNALAWVAAIGAAGVVYFIFTQFNKINKVQNEVGNTIGDAIDNIKEGASIEGGGSGAITGSSDLGNITITEVQAQSKASQLMEAMDRLGTDFDRIKNVLNGITPADFVLIADKFGLVRYNLTGRAFWPYPERNLLEWLALELNEDEMNELRQLHPKIFGT
ncbi:hypothetical protein [Flavobacteriaceae bacterium 14752]|uniref:hypothetical protein n=1 Tax=Mesohalobacter salilacus TaxID=2491711 RepID=UPI000F62CD89|nr:hypothetical protein EIG84_05890 [Flavobacteriaceae bacterium 14752]